MIFFGLSAKCLVEYAAGMAFGLLARGEYRERSWNKRGTDYDKSFMIAPELFFNQTTSLKFDFGRTYIGDDDELIATNYGLNFHKFIGQMVAIEARVTKYDFKSSKLDSIAGADTVIGLSAEFWF